LTAARNVAAADDRRPSGRLESGRASAIRWFVPRFAAVTVAAADLAAKAWAGQHVGRGPGEAIGIVQLRLARNSGASFGVGAHHPAVVIVGGLVSVSALAWWLSRARSVAERTTLAVALGGALGNLVERTVHGAVTDWLHVWPYPATFNLADVAVRAGHVAAAVCRLVLRRREAPQLNAGWVGRPE
jgi:signal peptidase II